LKGSQISFSLQIIDSLKIKTLKKLVLKVLI